MRVLGWAIFFVVLGLLGWGVWAIVTAPPAEPDRDYGRCLKSHAVQVPYSTGGAKGMVGIAYRQETRCDLRQYPHGDGPAYQAALPDYRRRLAEHQRDHPAQP